MIHNIWPTQQLHFPKIVFPFRNLVIFAAVSAAVTAAGVSPNGTSSREHLTETSPATGANSSEDALWEFSQRVAPQTLLSPPREVIRLLQQATALIAAQRYSEAIAWLQEVLLAPDDYFFPTPVGEPARRSLKAEAERLLLQLPEPGRKLYRLQYEGRAQVLLEEAIKKRDISGLLYVWKSFPLTESGVRAGILAVSWLLQHARTGEATRLLEQLTSWPISSQWQISAQLLLAGCYMAQGEEEKADRILRDLRAQTQSEALELGDQSIPWFTDRERPSTWFHTACQSLLPCSPHPRNVPLTAAYLGLIPERNGETSVNAPLLAPVWRARLADYPELEELLSLAERNDRAVGRTQIPASLPLVFDDIIVCRTLRGVVALDARTGKRIWQTASESTWDAFLSSSTGINPEYLPVLEHALRGRVWEDATAGALSGDGHCIYVLEEMGLPLAPMHSNITLARRQPSRWPISRDTNVLSAYELRTGRRLWQLPQASTVSNSLPEKVFFLGAPLPVAGSLFVLGYCEGEVRLFEIEATSGKLLWHLPLAAVQEPITDNWVLRTAGLSPSYHNGILVCPTAAGAIVAVDVLARRLIWGFSYREEDLPSPRHRRLWLPSLGAGRIQNFAALTNGVVIIGEGLVLVAPPDAEYIFCVDLFTGHLVRRVPRAETLYLGGIYQGQAILVETRAIRLVPLRAQASLGREPIWPPRPATRGSAEIEEPPAADRATSGLAIEKPKTPVHESKPSPAVDLAVSTGEPKGPLHTDGWSTDPAEKVGLHRAKESARIPSDPVATVDRVNPMVESERRLEFSTEGVVAGLGYRNGSRYFLPITSGVILEIDLDQLQVVRAQRPVRGATLGNLMPGRGKIVSQSGCRVDLFLDETLVRAEVASRGARQPNDPQALFLQAKLLLHEGKHVEALSRLEEVWRQKQTREVEDWLKEVCLEALKADFPSMSNRVHELEALFQEPEEKAQFLQLVAIGRESQQDWQGAWNAYRQLVELDWQNPGWLQPEPAWAIRTSVWLQQRLKNLLTVAPGEVQGQIRRFLDESLQAGITRPTEAAIRQGRSPRAARENWLRYFFDLPGGHDVALAHAQELAAAGSFIAAEYWLSRLLREASPGLARQAALTLARIYAERQRWQELALLVEAASQTEDKTAQFLPDLGKELPAEILHHPNLQRWLGAPESWPLGVTIRQEAHVRSSVTRPRNAIVSVVPQPPLISPETRMFLFSGRPTVAGFNSYGNKEWEFPFTELTEIAGFTFFRGASEALTLGHLTIVKGQTQAVALNTFTAGPQERAILLWGFNLLSMEPFSRAGKADPVGAQKNSEMTDSAQLSELWMLGSPGFENLLSQLVPIGHKWVAFVFRNQVAVVEPLTGDKLWIRRDLKPGAVVECDGQFIYIFSRSQPEVTILEADTGRTVASRRIPARLLWLSDDLSAGLPHRSFLRPVLAGNRILCEEPLPSVGPVAMLRFFLWDLGSEKRVWESPPRPADSAFTVVRRQFLAIWHRSGHLEIYRLHDGALLAKGTLPSSTQVDTTLALELFVNRWQILVLGLLEERGPHPEIMRYNIGISESRPILRGVLWAFDPQGRPMWPEPMTITQRWLPLDQPPDVPILVLPGIAQETQSDSQSSLELSLLLLDKRTGVQIADLRLRNPGLYLEIEGNVEQKAVSLRLQRSTFVLNFTDVPQAEGTAGQSSEEKVMPGLIDFLRRVISP